MALCYGKFVDCLMHIEDKLIRAPKSRHLIWRIKEFDPWYVSDVENPGGGLEAGTAKVFHDLMIIDAEIMADLKALVLAWKNGG